MRWTRRHWMATTVTTALSACAATPNEADERIVESASGQHLTPEAVLRRLRDADIVLLGELHDNPHHHARRAALLTALPPPAAVVAEHLPRAAATMLPARATKEALRLALEASGFDSQGWRWPLHEPLFAAIARTGMPLRGGNLPREAARQVAREGMAALPDDLAAWLTAAPLTGAAHAALMQDLMQGHCGHLSASRAPGMVAAQRGRDAAMAGVLLAELTRLRTVSGRGQVILLAGNGHVRLDYGVPTLLRQRRPQAQVLSIGFLEPAATLPPGPRLYDIEWTTPAAAREDPCQAFQAPTPPRPASS